MVTVMRSLNCSSRVSITVASDVMEISPVGRPAGHKI